jgi:hypothetical protein
VNGMTMLSGWSMSQLERHDISEALQLAIISKSLGIRVSGNLEGSLLAKDNFYELSFLSAEKLKNWIYF